MATRRQLLAGASAGAVPLLLGGPGRSWAQIADAGGAPIPGAESQLLQTAVEAYVFGYPLVTMEITRRVLTNVATPAGMHAPMGQFASIREYPTAAFKTVTAPNADTLYSIAWLDLAQEPYILHAPDEHGRYYLLPMLDGWTNVFADPGTRTTGTMAGDFAIVGPGWHGELPPGIEELRSPTNMVWILGRTYCTGTAEDYAAVHAIQDQYKLTPFSAWGKPYTPPAAQVDAAIDMKKAPREQVEEMDTASYFGLLAELMKQNRPAAADAPILARLASIGLVPGQDYDASKLKSAEGLGDVPKLAIERIMGHFSSGGADLNGWTFFRPAGSYGTDYLQRALVTRLGLGCNLPDDAVYPTTTTDSAGHGLDGANRYVVRFPRGMMPPARAFWSITMYDASYFFVANPLNRYTLSSRDSFKADPDGTVELYFQAASPGPEKESNWLPAPNGPFVLMLRMYWPKERPPSILGGTWKPPPVERV
ncbi:MAG TPA: DUF1254 domain-containing protein [Acetobacteraceae bacterium]|nr:DUF1254 domain-containing protein [Acetobacteraceae bacterium]